MTVIPSFEDFIVGDSQAIGRQVKFLLQCIPNEPRRVRAGGRPGATGRKGGGGVLVSDVRCGSKTIMGSKSLRLLEFPIFIFLPGNRFPGSDRQIRSRGPILPTPIHF
jgi:hypothetical protein